MNRKSKPGVFARLFPAWPRILTQGMTAALVPPAFLFFFATAAGAQTNLAASPLAAPALPDAGVSFLRVMGALALVIGVFLGGVWFFRNYQRLAVQRGAARLRVLETRSLGGRHAIFVVGYEQERFLISSSPGGVNLLSQLPPASENETVTGARSVAAPSFARALAQVLKGK